VAEGALVFYLVLPIRIRSPVFINRGDDERCLNLKDSHENLIIMVP
jgi:hypothetical protein